MTAEEELAIFELLREREAEFVRIWRCEGAVRRLLEGASYPFAPLLGGLPSRRRGKRTLRAEGLSRHGVTSAGKSSGGHVAPVLRKLGSGEDAFRIEFERHGELEASFQQDGELLRRLFQLEGEEFRILRICAVSFRSLTDWTELAELWRREQPDRLKNGEEEKRDE